MKLIYLIRIRIDLKCWNRIRIGSTTLKTPKEISYKCMLKKVQGSILGSVGTLGDTA
jgi:hypothetical protein